jgi:general L-amino acid transport system permease protein
MSDAFLRDQNAPTLPPPVKTTGPVAWLRDNLFSSVPNSILSLLGLFIIAMIVPPIYNFLIGDAVWTGESREACLPVEGQRVGACWAYVWYYLDYFIYGAYPRESLWRANTVFVMFAIGLVWMLWLEAPRRALGALYFFVLFPLTAYGLLTGFNPLAFLNVLDFGVAKTVAFAIIAWLAGLVPAEMAKRGKLPAQFANTFVAAAAMAVVIGVFGFLFDLLWNAIGLSIITTEKWGGIMISLIIAVTGIVASVPLGTLLALGRRSKLPVIKLFSVIFIEFVRGVPLITILFMASVMLPLFLPPEWSPDKLLRAIVGTALFTAAYMAETIRGGLQALPKGQYEGASAMGLGYWQSMGLIILPQVYKISIPNIVNSYVAMFKDTTLVFVVGIFDFLKTIDASLTNPLWASPTQRASGYAFAAIFYFLCCYGMSRYSKFVEKRLSAGDKR